jgi:hypothetical protein
MPAQLSALAFALVPLTAGAALAEPQRSGFLIGFSLGTGEMQQADCEDCDPLDGVALDIHLGGMITPRLALMFDGSAVSHQLGDGALTQAVDTVALQYWVTPRLWIKGGVGVAQMSVSDEDGETVEESETGRGALAAIGYELVQSRTFALDLQARVAAGEYSDVTITNGSVLLGFNWY